MTLKFSHPAVRILLIVPTFLGACLFSIGFIYVRTSLPLKDAFQRGMEFIIPFFFLLLIVLPTIIFSGIVVLTIFVLKRRRIQMRWWEFMGLPEEERLKLLAATRADRSST